LGEGVGEEASRGGAWREEVWVFSVHLVESNGYRKRT
jgi:hypothetical protein